MINFTNSKINYVIFLEKLKNEQVVNEVHSKCPKYNNVNEGASTSGINMSSETCQETSSNNTQELKTTQNQTKSNSKNNANCIPLTPEQVALEQILWVNKMYAIQMAEYWQS